jgi:pyridoxamine 5'-phosphate oxidase
MRRGYGDAVAVPLDETTVAGDWSAQLRAWFAAAVQAYADAVIELNAMQLATVDERGDPDVRTVLLKELDERGLVFYTNYDSTKGNQLAARPRAAAVLYWPRLERQVRVRGAVSKVDRAETEAYFATRPRGSQLGAWASRQSSVVASRAELELSVNSVTERFGDGEIPAPPGWGGYRIAPTEVEFWQGRADRMHDRVRYRLAGDAWVVERLAP